MVLPSDLGPAPARDGGDVVNVGVVVDCLSEAIRQFNFFVTCYLIRRPAIHHNDGACLDA
jgi:hypothetical protein